MRAVTLVLLAFVGLPAVAQEGISVGLGLGSLDYEESTNDPIFGDISDTVSSYKIYGMFEFNDYVAAEVSYGQSGEVEGGASGNDPFLGNFTSSLQSEFTTTVVKVIGMWPRDWGVVMGGLGYFDTDADISLRLISDIGSITSGGTASDDGLAVMLGVEWRFGRFGTGYGVRLEYEWWDVSDADAATIGVGVSYRF